MAAPVSGGVDKSNSSGESRESSA
ncbi:hypothetical protein CCACVL1_23772 [Corchorus capsularis]|uniref:Uncharacterized protein n=1 Tax=Corchorus capsularis TaxID=210143 RepID=A0A1R3GSP1_COCAP|nr:hypothetical protein CCACVL1_23772 [Corchorus capsularis]